MSQNMRATPCSAGRHGRVANVLGSGIAMESGIARCGPASAKTVRANAAARVYTQRGGVYGCSTTSGRTYRLGSSSATLGQPRVGLVRLAGSDAAYALSSHGVDT